MKSAIYIIYLSADNMKVLINVHLLLDRLMQVLLIRARLDKLDNKIYLFIQIYHKNYEPATNLKSVMKAFLGTKKGKIFAGWYYQQLVIDASVHNLTKPPSKINGNNWRPYSQNKKHTLERIQQKQLLNSSQYYIILDILNYQKELLQFFTKFIGLNVAQLVPLRKVIQISQQKKAQNHCQLYQSEIRKSKTCIKAKYDHYHSPHLFNQNQQQMIENYKSYVAYLVTYAHFLRQTKKKYINLSYINMRMDDWDLKEIQDNLKQLLQHKMIKVRYQEKIAKGAELIQKQFKILHNQILQRRLQALRQRLKKLSTKLK